MVKGEQYCAICGAPTNITHHLVFGRGLRPLADVDRLYIPVCAEHHTGTRMAIHDNTAAEILSKMLGQMMYERDRVAEGMTKEEARQSFMDRYGRNWL